MNTFKNFGLTRNSFNPFSPFVQLAFNNLLITPVLSIECKTSCRIAPCPIGSFFFPVLRFTPQLNPVSRFTAHSIDFLLSGSVNFSCDPLYLSFCQIATD
jgi:hypothetical protein